MLDSNTRVRGTLYVAFATSLLLSFAACGDSDGTESDTSGGTDTFVEMMDTGVDTGAEDTGTTEEDTGMDTAEPEPDTGTDAGADGGDTETDAGGSGTEVVMLASTTKSTADPPTTTIRSVVDFSSGAAVGEQTYETGDMVLDKSGGSVFAVNRICANSMMNCPDAGYVARLGVEADGTVSEAAQFELPDDVYNPYAAGVAQTQGLTFTVSYDTSDAYQYSAPGKPEDTLDLSPFDTGSESDDPEASDIAVDGDYVYFALQRLDGFTPKENSVLAGYDISSGEFLDFDTGSSGKQPLDLEGKNAVGVRSTPGGAWTAGLVGSFASLDGKIVKLSDEGNGLLAVDSTVVTEEQLNGNIVDYAFTGEEIGVAVVLNNGEPDAVTFDASGSSVQTSKLVDLGSKFSPALCLTPDRSEAWFAIRSNSQSEFVGYDPETGSELGKTGPTLDGGLPHCQFVEVSN